MRKTIEPQLKIGQVDIDSIAIDLNDRDELPQLLIGLQHIYNHRQTRDAIFDMLVEALGEKNKPRQWQTRNGALENIGSLRCTSGLQLEL